VLTLLREHRRFFLWTSLAALALRLVFFVYFSAVTDDSHVYMDLAANWLHHGIYGQTELGQIVPSDTRLPGYPAFLAAIFWLFGTGKHHAVLVTQILLDIGTCLIVADLARRVSGDRAARIAYLLAAVCPFLASYAAAVLTETLEVFFTALALDCAVAALDRMRDVTNPSMSWHLWAWTAASIGACILLRPDGGILLMAVALYAAWDSCGRLAGNTRAGQGFGARLRRLMVAEIILGAIALAPLVPWTIRNFRTLHHFQPLAPRYANESDELAPRGFNRWVRTWIADYVSVEEVYWNVSGDKIEVEKLPSRALDTAKEATLGLIADYNEAQLSTRELTPQLDSRFNDLAAARIRAHPVRYYVVLPLVRIADMWLRPRTELLAADVRWWEFDDDWKWSVLAVGFGLINLLYVVAALLALRGHSNIGYVGLFIAFLVMRSAFLGTLENPEPRYTLECYPVIIALGGTLAARCGKRDLELR
jgi:hypothetical protein